MTDAERIAALEAAVAELCDRAGVLWTPPATPAEGRETSDYAEYLRWKSEERIAPPPATAEHDARVFLSGPGSRVRCSCGWVSALTSEEDADEVAFAHKQSHATPADCGGRGRR